MAVDYKASENRYGEMHYLSLIHICGKAARTVLERTSYREI